MANRNTEVQIITLPINKFEKWASVPKVTETAQEMFYPSGGNRHFRKRVAVGGRNVMVAEAPELPGLDIPHFMAELNRTGKYFEGYFQHTATGFMKMARLPRFMLHGIRQQSELQAEVPPLSPEEAETSFFLRSLLAFDKLHQTHPFDIYIEPRSGQQDLDEYRDIRRVTRIPRSEQPQRDELAKNANLDDLLDFLTPRHQAELTATATIHRNRNDSYNHFAVDSLTSLNSDQPTKVLIPREGQAVYRTLGELEEAIKDLGIELKPTISLATKGPSWLDNLLNQFIKNPQRQITKEEVIVILTSTSLLDTYKDDSFLIGTEEDVYNTWGEVPPAELDSFVRNLLGLDPIEQQRMLLNYYGTRRGRGYQGIGMGDIFVSRAFDPLREKIAKMLRHETPDDTNLQADK